mgnify:CR=1 FL=1
MATNKFFKSLLFTLTIAISLFGLCIENSSAYPVFAQQGYSNPRAANGKLACANCHLNQKAIEIEAPQAVLPNSVFEVTVKVPYDVTRQQLGANGQKADLNVGGIVILPNGFKLAAKNQIPKEIKEKNKGVFISPYSTEFDNILVQQGIMDEKGKPVTIYRGTVGAQVNARTIPRLKVRLVCGAANNILAEDVNQLSAMAMEMALVPSPN